MHIGGTTAPFLRITSSTGSQGDLILQAGNSGGDVQMGNLNAAGDITFWTKPSGGSVTERLRIDSNGDLGLGIAAVPQDSGAKTLHIHHPTVGNPARAGIRLTTGTSGSAVSNGGFFGLDYNNNFYPPVFG